MYMHLYMHPCKTLIHITHNKFLIKTLTHMWWKWSNIINLFYDTCLIILCCIINSMSQYWFLLLLDGKFSNCCCQLSYSKWWLMFLYSWVTYFITPMTTSHIHPLNVGESIEPIRGITKIYYGTLIDTH